MKAGNMAPLCFLLLLWPGLALKSMTADMAAFMGSDAAKTQMFETVCDPETQGQPQHDAVIVTLLPPNPSTWRNGTAMKTIASYKRIQDNNRADVRLFHDEADHLSKEELDKMFAAIRPRRACATKIKFAQFPPGLQLRLNGKVINPIDTKDPGAHPEFGNRWGWRYMHMIRFFFADLIDPDMNMLQGYKFWLRMDADTEWADNIPDEFQNFDKDSKLGYLHNVDITDFGCIATDLNVMTKNFAVSHGIDVAKLPALTTVREDLPSPHEQVMGYYNFLEYGRIEMFQTPLALEYTRFILGTQGIYKHRWGDALLRRLVVELTGMETKRVPDSSLKKFRHEGNAIFW